MTLSRLLTLVLIIALTPGLAPGAEPQRAPMPGQAAPSASDLDALTAPIALYPDSLIAQVLLCAQSPYQVKQVNGWLQANPDLKGTELQDGATAQGFDSSFVALVIFPDVMAMMANDIDWTTNLGMAFATNKDAVFDSIQRLRTKAKQLGNLESNEQQKVVVETVSTGQQVIVIQPANPQIIYVPTYNPQVVYVQSAPVYVSSPGYSAGTVAAAGVIGFAAGVVVGAALDDDWCGGWGWHGGCCYSGGWNNYYQHQENMWKTYQKQLTKRTEIRQENWTERQGNRQDGMTDRQGNRQNVSGDRQANRMDTRQNTTDARTANAGDRQAARTSDRAAANDYATRGRTQQGAQPTQRTADRSGAFSGYQNGNAERAASSRGNRSVSSSSAANRSGGRSGGASRSGGGGGRRR